MTRSIFFMALAIAALAILWFAFRPTTPATGSAGRADTASAVVPAPGPPAVAGAQRDTASAAPAPAVPPHQVFDFVMKNGRLVSGPNVMRVHEGERVTLHITADRSDELH